MTIKAIPTTYRGIQMRSKLEARAAEMFDAWGVRWVYEAEGFDLDGVWYLPDFWLPDLKAFVEVKGLLDESVQKTQALARRVPRDVRVFLATAERIQTWSASDVEHSQLDRLTGHSQEAWRFTKCNRCGANDLLHVGRTHCVDVYLAGKVRGSKDWRLDLVPGLRRWTASESMNGSIPWRPMPFALDGTHSFVGPFFLTDREATDDAHEREWNGASHLGGIGGYKAHDPNDERRGDIAVDCLIAIRNADIVLAWLDDLTAYGTLVEIGFAIALNKCVVVGGPGGRIDDNLWFAKCLTARSSEETPRAAFADALHDWRYGFNGRSFA